MFVPLPPFICWNLTSKVMILEDGVIGIWLGQKGGALMNGISILIQEAPESSLASPTIWGHKEKLAIYEPGRRLSPDTESAGVSILEFPAARMVRNKLLLFISHPVHDILLEQIKWTKTNV